jgi:hypothetical protein
MNKPIETENRLAVARVWGHGSGGEWMIDIYEVSFGGDKKTLELDRGDDCIASWVH